MRTSSIFLPLLLAIMSPAAAQSQMVIESLDGPITTKELQPFNTWEGTSIALLVKAEGCQVTGMDSGSRVKEFGGLIARLGDVPAACTGLQFLDTLYQAGDGLTAGGNVN